jgi:predicted Zn-dependent protease
MNESVADLGEHTGLTTLVKAGTQMTPRQSYSLGRICAAKILANHEPIRSEAVSSYINILGKYLAMHSQSPQIYKGYQFILIEGEAPYAVSTPGGFVFISSGMISLTQTEDELAAILAHEIGHISLKHAEAAIQTANRLDLFGGMVFKTAGYATDFATKTVGLDKVQVLHDLKVIKALKVFDAVTDFVLNEGFNQAQELEADQEALQILRNAGYSSAALETVIAKISDDSGLGNLHPGGKKRIEAIHNGITETRVLASQSGAEEATTKTLKRFLAMKEKLKPHDLVEDRY